MNLSNVIQWQYDHCRKDQKQKQISETTESEKNSNFVNNNNHQITDVTKIFNSTVKAKQLKKINCQQKQQPQQQQQQQQEHQKFLLSSLCQIQMNQNNNNYVMSMKFKNYLYNVFNVNCVNINDNKKINCISDNNNNNKIKSTYHHGGVFFIYIFVIFLICGNQLNFVNCLNNEQRLLQHHHHHRNNYENAEHDHQSQHKQQDHNNKIKFLLNNNNTKTTYILNDTIVFNDSILQQEQQRNHNNGDIVTNSNKSIIQNFHNLLNTNNYNQLLSKNNNNSKTYLKSVANIVNSNGDNEDDDDDRNESANKSDNDVNVNVFSELVSNDFNKNLNNNSINYNTYLNGGSYKNYSNLKNSNYYDDSFNSLEQQQQQNRYNQTAIYLNEFAVHIPSGKDVADIIASKYGFTNVGQIGSLKDYYLFHHHHVSKRSLRKSDSHHVALESEHEVLWVQQQHEKIRKKRDYVRTDLRFPSITPHHQQQQPQQNIFDGQIATRGLLRGIAPQSRLHYRDASSHNIFPDPLFKEQWYLNGGAKDGLDMNVGPAWQKGYTGKGVVVSILDDGIQTNHPDLAQNYDPDASYDINGNDSDPMPQDNGDNKHGTRCAGEVAAVAFNNYCGVGVAYNASIGGVRMLDGSVNDAVEAKALSLNPQHIDIYSASWGPEDDGSTVDGPGPLARRAFIYGVTSGRQGKGSIFVWASGNGGRYTDSCNCDGYTNSIFTLSISSATQGGFKPWYLEECSSTLATTYSSGTPGHDKSVATVDMDGRLRPDHICTVEHTGTSASAPLAAGICALALEANPSLTWRDMQYLVVMTSRPEPLEKEMGWILNGVKRKYSHKFGYGLMDAGAMVSLAEQWTTVPPQHICKSRENNEDRPIEGTYGYTLQTHMDVNGCAGTINEVRYLEHVQCKITLRFFPRGNLRILLTSPMGTTSTLLFERPRDIVKSNFDDWPFLSVHFWGEKAEGRWTLQVINGGRRRVNQPGILSKWQLIFYGTQTNPIRLKSDVQDISSLRRLQGLNPFVFPTDSDLGQPTGSFYNNDPYSGYLNYQNLFTGAGSNPEKSIATVDGHNIPTPQRQNVMADSNNKLVLHDCDPECDSQGCYGRGPTQCVACKHYRLDNTCVSRCPPRSFPNQGGVCWPCHESCETCAGAGQDSCLTCAPAHLHVTDLAVCLQMCPDGYYENYDNKTCVPCEANCASCQERPDYCTSCDHHLVMHEHKCYSACPIHTYETEDYSCAPCHPTCATCNGSSESQCITCRSGRFTFNGKCLNNCPDGYYGDKKRQECVLCPTGCATCSSNGFCLTCKGNWNKNKKGKCIANGSDNCNESEYYDNGRCHPCHSTCETCIGPTETNCLTCPSNLLLQNNRCVNTCDDGYYVEAGVCAKCLHTCTKCVSRINCTACAKGLQLQSGECSTTCADGYYSDRGTCAKCYLSCHTCSGPRRDQCVECPNGWQLAGGECHPECPEGFYKSEFGCQKCHHYCKTCNGAGPLACTSCPSHFMLDGGLCMECLGSQYYDQPTQSCKTCHESCRSCSGPGQYSCQTCAFPLNLDRLNNQCVPCCPSTDTPSDDQSCCHCDKDTGGCINASPAGKRRISVGVEQQLQFSEGNNPDLNGYRIKNNIESSSSSTSVLSHVGSPLTTITAVAVAGCLLIITIFAVIFAVLQRNSYATTKGSIRRTHTGVKYNKLLTKSKEKSSTTLQIHLNEHEDDNFEYDDDDNDDEDEDCENYNNNGFEQEDLTEQEKEKTENNDDFVNGDSNKCSKNISFYVDYSKNTTKGNKKFKNITFADYKTGQRNLNENNRQTQHKIETFNTRHKASKMSVVAAATDTSLPVKNHGKYDVCLSLLPSPSSSPSRISKIMSPSNNNMYKRMKTNDYCIEDEVNIKSENIKGSTTTTNENKSSATVTEDHHHSATAATGTKKPENVFSSDDGQYNKNETVISNDHHPQHIQQQPKIVTGMTTITTSNQNLINYNNTSDD